MSEKRKLGVLRIESPCTVPWESMRGNDRERHCRECNKSVHNLITMTADEVYALFENAACDSDVPCVQMYQRADGTVLTADCQDIVRKKRVRLRVFTALFSAASLLGCSGADTNVTPAAIDTTRLPPVAPVATQAYSVEHVVTPPAVDESPEMGQVMVEPPIAPAPTAAPSPTSTTTHAYGQTRGVVARPPPPPRPLGGKPMYIPPTPSTAATPSTSGTAPPKP